MKAIVATAYSGIEGLELRELEEPRPGEGEVLVDMCGASINPVDWKVLDGGMASFLPARFPYVVGWDLAGTVRAVGYAARRFDVGDSVYGYIRRPVLERGTFAEAVAVPECYLAKAPRDVSLTDCGAIPLAGLAAYQALVTVGKLVRGETVLILGAAGGVGTFASQIARNLGARVVGTARPMDRERLATLGVREVIDYLASDWVEQARRHMPTFVLDCVGGDSLNGSVGALHTEGRVVSLVARQLAAKTIPFAQVTVEPNARHLDVLADWASQGALVPNVSERVPLEGAIDAMSRCRQGLTVGKVVITSRKPD